MLTIILTPDCSNFNMIYDLFLAPFVTLWVPLSKAIRIMGSETGAMVEH